MPWWELGSKAMDDGPEGGSMHEAEWAVKLLIALIILAVQSFNAGFATGIVAAMMVVLISDRWSA